MPYFEFVGGSLDPKLIVTTVLIAVCLLTPQNGVAQINFGSPVDYLVGSGAGPVAVGDFNNDGQLDLAVANRVSNDVSILLGNPDGTFQSAVNYGVGVDPESIAVVDLNLDNKMDLAVSFVGDSESQQGGINVLLGNGDGTFQPATTIALNTRVWGLAVGDFNGDHKPDIAATTGVSASILLGNGDGAFQAPVAYEVTGGAAESIAVGDFNADKKQDVLVITNTSRDQDLFGKTSVFLGNGDGTFQHAIENGLGGSAAGGVVGDFNGDGKLDLAIITKENVFSIPAMGTILGNGDGTFRNWVVVDPNNFDSFVTVADLNADGKSDLLALSFPHVPSARVFLGRGDDTFDLAQTIVFSRFGPAAAAIGDFNGDHLADLAVTMPSNAVSILLNTTTDFTMSISELVPASVTPGQSATSTLTVGAANGFAGSVSFACSVSPKPALAPQCSISPGSVNAGTPATLTVTTTAAQSAMASPRGFSGILNALWLPICGLMFVGMVFPAPREERRLVSILPCALLLVALLMLPSCGGGSGGGGPRGQAGTPLGTYTITVTGTSGTTHSTTATLRVQ